MSDDRWKTAEHEIASDTRTVTRRIRTISPNGRCGVNRRTSTRRGLVYADRKMPRDAAAGRATERRWVRTVADDDGGRSEPDSGDLISPPFVRVSMPEDVLFTSESKQSRNDIASYLRAIADKLESGETVSLSAGDQSVSLSIPASPTFEVKAEHEDPAGGGSGELSLELEIEWDEDAGDGAGGGDGSLSVE